ncbi:MAG TPA: 1-phosphofructokinase family hexose kinase [Nitrospirales bacterium]|nr:1-phosphofructokinase family hexose kinase [Nitrospirales bacterium]
MITIAGFNTSIDRWLDLKVLNPGEVQRVREVGSSPGGKGLHVALTCAALGEEVRLVGIISKSEAAYVGKYLDDAGVIFQSVRVAGDLRDCLAIHEQSGRTTELLGPGPSLSRAESSAALAGVRSEEIMVFSGSVPPDYPDFSYQNLITSARERGAYTIIDSSGDLLREAIKGCPDLIKMNAQEAGELAGQEIDGKKQAIGFAQTLLGQKVGAVVVSLGASGAVLVTPSGAWALAVPEIEVRSAVGAGDCLVAGIAVALSRKRPLEEAFQLGGACGAAKTRRIESGILEANDVNLLKDVVQVTRWHE